MRAPITDKHLLEMMWERFPEIMQRGTERTEQEPDFGPQPGMHGGLNPDDWKDIVAAISKVRDHRGIYLACRPADVFQDWFLAMGLFKPKEKNT